MLLLLLVFVAGLWAGLQNALAGGGSFVTLPALIVSGMSPLAANITSTVALFPGQVTSGLAGRKLVTGAGRLPFKALFILSIVGGALGGLLLLNTPSKVFARLVPWLVLFATAVFAWGSFRRRPAESAAHLGPWAAGVAQLLIAIYGGYFGGGIGFLMMAALTMAGLPTRNAGAIAGGVAGNAIEKNAREGMRYEVHIAMDNGRREIVHQRDLDGVYEGARVTVSNGRVNLL